MKGRTEWLPGTLREEIEQTQKEYGIPAAEAKEQVAMHGKIMRELDKTIRFIKGK